MIRMYFSVSKCVKSLHSLKRTERAAGIFSNLKNYSVSVTSEFESKPKNEAEEEEVTDFTVGEKSLISTAFAKLKNDESVNGDKVKSIQKNEKESTISEGSKPILADDLKSKFAEDYQEDKLKTVRDLKSLNSVEEFKDDLQKLKNLVSSHENLKHLKEMVPTEKLKKLVSTLQEKIGQKPPPIDENTLNAEALQQKVTDYVLNVRPIKKRMEEKVYSSKRVEGYLQKLEQQVKQGKKLTVTEIITALKSMIESRTRPEPWLKLFVSKLMSQDNLDIKECSDVLYCLAGLHYREENIIAKITENVCLQMDSLCHPSAVNCMLRSYAMLSYRDPTILTILIDWINKNREHCKYQVISNAIMSLAVLNYFPAEAQNLVQEFSDKLNLQDSPDTSTYLDNVWSLVLLNCATHELVKEVLSLNFIEKIKNFDSNQISFSKSLKLLNINGYAVNVLQDYRGPFVTNSIKDTIPSPKYKTTLISSVIDALLNLMPSADYIVTNLNTRYGFVIDAEFFVDAQGKPLPYVLKANRSGSKIAVLVLGYFDLCFGAAPAPTGPVALSQRILEAKGYKVLLVPYTEFPPNRKLIEKLQFLDKKIKELAAS